MGQYTTAITVLGATGSIGLNTLDVIRRHPEEFSVFALTAHRQIDKLAQLCQQFMPQYAVVADEIAARQLQQQLQHLQVTRTQVLFGQEALCEVSQASEVDGVMVAIVGAAALLPALSAAKAGKTIYLANKETLVMAGALFMQTIQQSGARLLPVDSEHNAIFQTLPENYNGQLNEAGVASLILTASGGPFLHTPVADFAAITPEQAIKHPNWHMGQKISVDSASMMNKGLELIEAHWLFNAPANQLEVIIHPQSIIHSMVRYIDGSVLAQLGEADMRIPIAYCMGLRHRMHSGAEPLDFTANPQLTFLPPDFERFPCLKLAYDVLHSDNNAASCILNAANEVAVAAFLNHQLRFTDLSVLVDFCLQKLSQQQAASIDELMQLDARVRTIAQEWINKQVN
ncbi:1-deoxy-D-xylulose-5-phosphate reductoisomerase [Neisseriaceae bacterium ESL0693]|nr:1-deoxy-D-xylulose-5-phosphate reductoisomerase [Neisseriaceae bacterium ESL0693]